MSTQLSMFWGTTIYEFRMQLRRRALWIVMGLLIILTFYWQRSFSNALLYYQETWQGSTAIKLAPTTVVVMWANLINRFLPIAIGILLADRLPRDRQTKMEEMLTTLPARLGSRLLGKYVGCLCATIIPAFLYYCLGVGVVLIRTQSLAILPTALLAFLSILLPGMLFVGAFSLVCPAFLWWPIYCFGFTAYWFWGNLLSPLQRIPTISGTMLTPLGGYMSQGFFGIHSYGPVLNATALQGEESLLLLLGVAGIALLIAWRLLLWQRSRQ